MIDIKDNDIIDSIKRGNVSDFTLLIDKYKNRAFSLLRRMLKDEMEAEDVLQESFIKAYYALPGFQYKSKFSTWFYRIVYNSALTKLASKKRNIEKGMSSLEEELNLTYVDTSDDDKELKVWINKMIEQLPAKYSAVINFFYNDDLSCEEIGEVMGTSVSNVKVILHRARTALKDMMIKNKSTEEILWLMMIW